MMDTIMDGDDVVFLHQLVDGVTRRSHALHIATVAGLSPGIIERSAEVKPGYLLVYNLEKVDQDCN